MKCSKCGKETNSKLYICEECLLASNVNEMHEIVEKSGPIEMKLFDEKFELSVDEIFRLHYRSKYTIMADEARNKFKELISNITTYNSFIKKVDDCFVVALEKPLLSLVLDSISIGCDSIDKTAIIDYCLKNSYFDDFKNVMSEYGKQVEKVELELQMDLMQNELERESKERVSVVSYSNSFVDSVINDIKSDIANGINDLGHDFVKSTKDSMANSRANSKFDSIINNSKLRVKLINSVYSAALNLPKIMFDLSKNKLDNALLVDYDDESLSNKADVLCNNLESLDLPFDTIKSYIKEIIFTNPENYDYYRRLIKKYRKEDFIDDVVRIEEIYHNCFTKEQRTLIENEKNTIDGVLYASYDQANSAVNLVSEFKRYFESNDSEYLSKFNSFKLKIKQMQLPEIADKNITVLFDDICSKKLINEISGYFKNPNENEYKKKFNDYKKKINDTYFSQEVKQIVQDALISDCKSYEKTFYSKIESGIKFVFLSDYDWYAKKIKELNLSTGEYKLNEIEVDKKALLEKLDLAEKYKNRNMNSYKVAYIIDAIITLLLLIFTGSLILAVIIGGVVACIIYGMADTGKQEYEEITQKDKYSLEQIRRSPSQYEKNS